MAEQRFRAKAKATERWVKAVAIGNGCVTYEYTGDWGEAAVFGPDLRQFWEARADGFEIVPEPPPFVLPPTPWARSGRDCAVDANGESAMTRGHSDRHVGLIRDEMIRRVNWHDMAVEALRRIKRTVPEGCHTHAVASDALAELPEGPTP